MAKIRMSGPRMTAVLVRQTVAIVVDPVARRSSARPPAASDRSPLAFQ